MVSVYQEIYTLTQGFHVSQFHDHIAISPICIVLVRKYTNQRSQALQMADLEFHLTRLWHYSIYACDTTALFCSDKQSTDQIPCGLVYPCVLPTRRPRSHFSKELYNLPIHGLKLLRLHHFVLPL